MKTVLVKDLSINNFENIKHFQYVFNETENIFEAKNGSGKTSIKKAFLFLLGLDVGSINPILNGEEITDEKGEPLETAVEGNIQIDTLIYKLVRKQKPVFSIDKITGARTKKANSNFYYIDDVKINTATAYEQFFKDKLGVDLETLYFLADIERFNEDNPPKWKWDIRRNRLINLCNIEKELGNINLTSYNLISDDLLKGRQTTDIKSDLKSKLLLSNTRLDNLNAQITSKTEENTKYSIYNFDEIRAKISELNRLQLTFNKSSAKSNADIQISNKNAEKSKLVSKRNELIAKDEKEIAKLTSEINYQKFEITRLENANRAFYEADTQPILAQIKLISEQKWNGGAICPTCGQSLPKSLIDNAVTSFETTKETKLGDLNTQLKKARETNSFIDLQKNENNDKIKNLQAKIESIEEEQAFFEPNEEIANLNSQIAQIDAEIQTLISSTYVDNADIELDKIKQEIASQNQLLTYETIIAERNAEIKDLMKQKLETANENVILMKKQEQLQKYTNVVVGIVQNALDKWLGNGVSFMLYEPTYSGDLKEVCVATWKERTYDIMSRGERIHTNIEVQKALQNAYGITMPIWIDDFESFTEEYDIKTQSILLFAIRNKEINGLVKLINNK